MAASDKAVIVKFLKDNNITADPDDSQMHELDSAFMAEMKAKREKRAEALLSSDPAADNESMMGLFI